MHGNVLDSGVPTKRNFISKCRTILHTILFDFFFIFFFLFSLMNRNEKSGWQAYVYNVCIAAHHFVDTRIYEQLEWKPMIYPNHNLIDEKRKLLWLKPSVNIVIENIFDSISAFDWSNFNKYKYVKEMIRGQQSEMIKIFSIFLFICLFIFSTSFDWLKNDPCVYVCVCLFAEFGNFYWIWHDE